MLVQYKVDIIIISSNVTYYRHDIAEALIIKQQLLTYSFQGYPFSHLLFSTFSEFTSSYSRVRVAPSLVLCVVFCRSLFVL